MHLRHRVLPILVCVAATLGGCKVTGDDIEYWKGTVKGPGKIVAVIVTDKYPLELRTQGALALVEMERNDVNGVAELQRAVQRLGEEPRRELIDAMVPGLQQLMRGGEAAQPETDDLLSGPPPQQVRAKDAAFLLISHASANARQQLTESVVDWYVVDFNGRNLAGDYSAEQIIRALGSPAAAKLVDALNARMPQQALVKIAELIAQLGDLDTKTRAAARLVEIEREMEGAEYLGWLKQKILDSLQEQGREADDEAVTRVAELNRENFINEGALPAMKHLAGIPSVADRLLEMAEAQQNPEDRRKRALQALEGHANEAQLQRYLALALSDANPISVRDYSFDRVADIRSRDAIAQLWPLVQVGDNDELKKRLRWRAAELVLSLGGPEIVSEWLGKLPSGDEVEYEPEELESYATTIGRMTPPPTALMTRQLESSTWWRQVMALRYFERKGTAADIPRMQALASNATEVVGSESWGETNTVGKVAEAAITALRERLEGGATEAGSSEGGEQQ